MEVYRYLAKLIKAEMAALEESKPDMLFTELYPESFDTVCLVGSQSIQEERRIGNVILRPFFDAESLMPYCQFF